MIIKRVIDISKWNTVINFSEIKSDCDGVIIRLGYRGNSTGKLTYDPLFTTNINGLTSVNVPIGIYWFTNAINEAEGIEEAEFVINTIEKLNLNLSFPIIIDTEYGHSEHKGRADNIDNNSRTIAVKAFLDKCISSGYEVAIYASDSWYKDHLIYDEIKDYQKWVAKYSKDEPTVRDNLIGWQKSSNGTCKGINGRVDVNDWYININSSAFKKKKKTDVTSNVKPTVDKSHNKKETNKLDDGTKITLENVPLYSSSTTDKVSTTKSGTFYIWNKVKRNGRVRITTKKEYVKELGKITGWVNVSDIK